MTDSERRTLAGVACFLLLASVLRHGLDRRVAPAELPDEPARAESLEAEARAVRDDEEARSRPLGADERIDLNEAPEVELNRLRGVGRATAAAIVLERETGGPFTSVGDLVRVRGIGPATMERIRPHAEVAPGLRASGRAGSPPSAGGPSAPVDVNVASREELTSLPGIGPAIAGRIAEVRAARGGFGRVEDLLEVPGIGPATLERLRPLVRAGR